MITSMNSNPISLLLGLMLVSSASAGNKDLLDLMTTPLGEKELASRLEDPGSYRGNAKGRFPLKEFEAFGIQFHGAVSSNDSDPKIISVSCKDADLSPAEAASVSAKIEEAISVTLGQGREVKDIPNHEDATPVKSRGRIWAGPQGSVIQLETDDYSNRANLSVVRYVDEFPLAESGEAKDFWLEHLKALQKEKEEADAEAKWLEKHSAGVVFRQRHEGKLTYSGTLTYQQRQTSLGETPPLYQHHIKAGNTAILLGQLDNRHRLSRHIHTVRNEDAGLKVEPVISVGSPGTAGGGGFVFVDDGASISRFGVIVPIADVPAGHDPEAEQWHTSIRLHRQGAFQRDLTREEILAIPNQEILPAWKVLMETGFVPGKVRIIWYRVEPSGDFKLDM